MPPATSGRGPRPAGSAGHLQRPRRPARPGQRPHLPRRDRAAGDRGVSRPRSGTCRRHWASAADLGDRPGQASALTFLGAGEWLTGDYPGAARDLQEALGICRDLGDRPGQANALTWLGVVRRLTGDYPAAARGPAGGAGHLPGPRLTWRGRGQRPHPPGGGAAADRGLPGRGRGTCRRQLGICRDRGDRLERANALNVPRGRAAAHRGLSQRRPRT